MLINPFEIKVFQDGDKWCALVGGDLQSGVAGFGDDPGAALADFCAAMFKTTRLGIVPAFTVIDTMGRLQPFYAPYPTEVFTLENGDYRFDGRSFTLKREESEGGSTEQSADFPSDLEMDLAKLKADNSDFDEAIHRLYGHVDRLTHRLDTFEKGLTDIGKRFGNWDENYKASVEELRKARLQNNSLYDDLYAFRERLEALEKRAATPLNLAVASDPIAEAIAVARTSKRYQNGTWQMTEQQDGEATIYTFGQAPQPTEPITLNPDGTLPRQPVSDGTVLMIAEAVVNWLANGPRTISDAASNIEMRYQKHHPDVWGVGRGDHTKIRVIADWLKEVLNDSQPN